MTASAASALRREAGEDRCAGSRRFVEVVAPRELLALGVVERLFGGHVADALQALLDAAQLRLRRGLDVRRRRFGGGLRRFGRGGRRAARRRRRRSLRSAAFVRAPSSDAAEAFEAFELARAGGARRRGTSPRRFLQLGQPSVFWASGE